MDTHPQPILLKKFLICIPKSMLDKSMLNLKPPSLEPVEEEAQIIKYDNGVDVIQQCWKRHNSNGTLGKS